MGFLVMDGDSFASSALSNMSSSFSRDILFGDLTSIGFICMLLSSLLPIVRILPDLSLPLSKLIYCSCCRATKEADFDEEVKEDRFGIAPVLVTTG